MIRDQTENRPNEHQKAPPERQLVAIAMYGPMLISLTIYDASSSKNASISTGGDLSPRYNTGMALFRCHCRKLVTFFENFVSRGWQRLVIFFEILVL